MKRQIVVEIDCEDERCGECRRYPPFAGCWEIGGKRGPLCIAAEKKLRDLVEAGERIKLDMCVEVDAYEAWDAAVAAIRGEGE